MAKKVCKLAKDDLMKDELKKYVKLMDKPKYVCTKCGHVANEEENLCKPKKI